MVIGMIATVLLIFFRLYKELRPVIRRAFRSLRRLGTDITRSLSPDVRTEYPNTFEILTSLHLVRFSK